MLVFMDIFKIVDQFIIILFSITFINALIAGPSTSIDTLL